MSEPMSDAELDAIRQRLQQAAADATAGNSTVYVDEFVYLDMPRLLAEVERLRAEHTQVREDVRSTLELAHQQEAENAAMRPIVAAVAECEPAYAPGSDTFLRHPERNVLEIREQARALLAKES